ncbi:MAG: hypothetical protein AB7I52_13770 [Rhizobiaceae bacterium]
MDDAKPWYLSRTIWASLVTIGCATAGMAGLPVTGADGGALTEAILNAVMAGSGLLAVFGRLAARSRIG